ncbi:hypothetical protein [Streptomyces sp. WAC01526]|uniref:hypothetical protein n=1 Tax=Streptomyces sp. WAC01526 TaxID=2588709 RepID=UPI001652303A|nr:hypothetical protein [Streptomyces sp. WAC01526]
MPATRAAPSSGLLYNHQGRRADSGDLAIRGHDADGISREHQNWGRPLGAPHLGAGQPWIAGHLQFHRDPRILLGQGRKRPTPQVRGMQRRGHSPRRGTQQHRGQGHKRAGRPESGRAAAGRLRSSPPGVGPRSDTGLLLRPWFTLGSAPDHGHP